MSRPMNMPDTRSMIERQDSMRLFERLQGQILFAAVASAAVAMTAFVCVTARLLG